MSFSQKRLLDSADSLVVNFVATEDQQTAKIDLENSFFQSNLLQTKLSLTFASLDNTAVPAFIPLKLNTMPSYVDVPNLIPNYSSIGIDSLNYVIAMNSSSSIVGAKYAILQHISTDPYIAKPSTILNQKQVYSTPYYYSYTISHILKIIENALIDLFQALYPASVSLGNPQFVVIFNGTTISIVQPTTVGSPAVNYPSYIFISSELFNLLRMNGIKTGSSSQMYLLNEDTDKNYNGVDSFVYNSRFLSRDWTAFDTILITTTLPIKAVEYQTNISDTNQSSTEYKNVVFALNTLSDTLNFYPYYEYTPTTTDLFKSFSQDNFGQSSFTLNFFLYNKRNGLSIPYKLNKGEMIVLDFLIQEKNV